jgi:DNA-binding FadR family transcriptional regulator
VALWAPELEILAVQGGAMLQALTHADPAIAQEAVRRHVAASRTYMTRMLKVPELPLPLPVPK